MSATPLPSADWFKNPDGTDTLRYWDGSAWTQHTAPMPPQWPAPSTVPQPAGHPPSAQTAPSGPVSAPPPTAVGPLPTHLTGHSYAGPPAYASPALTAGSQAAAQVAQQAMSAPFAGWWLRLGAYFIDALILLVPNILLALLIFPFGFILSPGLLFAYGLLMTRQSSENGQTLGMQVVGIRVRREDGTPVDVQVVAIRELLMKGIVFGWGAILIIPFLLDYLWPLWDAENRALHDMAAKTRVVQAPKV